MNYMFLLTVFFLYILHLNGAKRMNVAITLHRKDIFSLFSEGEIWGKQYVNITADIVQLNVVIDGSRSMEMRDLLKKNVIMSFDLIYPDVDKVIRRQISRINNTEKWTSSMLPDLFFLEYRSWPEYVLFIDALLLRFPVLTSRSYMGQTIQDRDIPVITLSTGNGGGVKPGFYIQAELHAREWLANAATMYILNALAEGYGNDDRITNILDSVNIYIVPTVNIDGYIYSWIGSDERMWRKNRRNNNDGSFGVDLNRNYDGPIGTWCTTGASTNPSSNTYCGTAPFSEPEAEASAQFMLNATYNIGAAIDMHTSGPLILWPWGYSYTQLPPPYYQEFVNLGAELQTAVAAVHGVQYTSMQSSGLYPASGDVTDFAWSQSDSTIVSFTFEGRGPGFNPPPENIIPAGQEQLAAILTLAETLIN